MPPDVRPPGGVQSIGRAFTLLEAVAANGNGMGLSELAASCDLPLTTIHRLVRTLVDLSYLRQEPSRQYALGPRLLLLAESSSTMLDAIAAPYLRDLVESLGETANLAMLDGDQVAYVAQVPGRHSMRMFTEVGARVLPHGTAVGKALLARVDANRVRALLSRTGMPRHTDHTITDPDMFVEQMHLTAERGYAMDEGEKEVGVRCVAVAVPHHGVQLALSVSGPATRMSDDLVARAVPSLSAAATALATTLTQTNPRGRQ